MSLVDADPTTRVTVVVPTRNSARTISPCLDSLYRQTHPCRVVVVDNDSTDGTIGLARSVADLVLEGGPERSAQRNKGARAAPNPVVGFVDSDMILEAEVVEQAVIAIEGGAGAVIVPERTVGEGYWARVRAFERSFYDGSDAIEAARFYRWDVFERAGGFDENLTGTEDWDLTIEARQVAPVARITARIDHDEDHVHYVDACRKKRYYAEGLRRFTAKRGIGALCTVGTRPWIREPTRLATPVGVGLIALKAGEVASVLWSLVLGHVRASVDSLRQP
ncbi:MAG: glycosyltransferase family 2 protein [Acidimicrobiales bacterium]